MNKTYIHASAVLTLIAFILVVWATYKLQQVAPTIPRYAPPAQNLTKLAQNVAFRDNTLQWGLNAQHRQTSNKLSSFLEVFGAGICVLDADQDGWMDVFVVGGSGFTREYGKQAWWHKIAGNRLFLNQQGKYLKDVSAKLGQSELQAGMACAVADLDGDGDTDLVVSGFDGHFLYANDGSGVFTKIENTVLRKKGKWATQAAFADVNHDGLPDIYASNFINYQKGAKTIESKQGFIGDKSVDFKPSLYDPQTNQLFINRGNFEFSEIEQEYFVNNVLGRSLGARWHDFNHDGSLDLLVLNDFDSANRLYLNNGQGSFSEAKDEFRTLQISGTRDMIIDDLDGNGLKEFFFTQRAGTRNSMLKQHVSEQNKAVFRLSNSAQLTKEDTLYADHWGAISADLNNDGSPDLYVAAGLANSDPDAPHVPIGQANRVYVNQGNGDFIAHSGEDPSVAPKSSRGAVSVDLNNDGQLELLVANNNDSVQLLQVEGRNTQHWLGIAFVGSTKWQGAEVLVRTKEKAQIQNITYKQSLFSQSDPRLHFGLAQAQQVDEILITSLDGQVISFRDLQSDRYYQIIADQNSIKSLTYKVQLSPLLSDLEQFGEQALVNLARLIMTPELNLQEQLPILWKHATLQVKKQLLTLLDKKSDQVPMYLVFEALRDKNPELRLMAIKILKKQELEYSIHWLIPLLSEADPKLVCAVADALQFFFEEEEAVVYRKQLTVPPMLKLLANTQDGIKICLLKALGAAENKRALYALLALLNEQNSDDVSAETIRALGLLRDTTAIDSILSTMQKSQSAEVMSAGFIALSRLNYEQLDALMSAYFSVQTLDHVGADEAVLLSRLNTLQKLYENQESVVLNTDWLYELNGKFALRVKLESSAQMLISFLNTLIASQNPQFFPLAKKYLSHQDPQVAEHAFIASFGLLGGDNSRLLENNFLKLPANIQQNILINLRGKYRFSRLFMDSLIEQYKQDDLNHQAILRLVSLTPKPNQSSFVSTLLLDVPAESQIKLLQFATQKSLPLINSKALIKSTNKDISRAFLYWYYQVLDLDTENKPDLAMRIKLNSVIFDDNVLVRDKVDLLQYAASRDPYVANQFFDYYKEHLPVEKVLEIIDRLAQDSRSSKLVQYLKDQLLSKSASKAQKLFAAAALPVSTEDDIRLYFD